MIALIQYGEKNYALVPGLTLLDALQQSGAEIPSSCRSGVCQSCLMQAVEGTPPPASQRGLSAAQVAQGYFLSCLCEPTGPLSIRRADESLPRFACE